MPRIIYGEKLGETGVIRVACSASLMKKNDEERILLTRRRDNNQWCLPGGGLDKGESISECCIREFLEETGLLVKIERLIGIYSNPNAIVEYKDGNRYQLVVFHFLVATINGSLKINEEVKEFGFFTKREVQSMDVISIHRRRIEDTFQKNKEVFIR